MSLTPLAPPEVDDTPPAEVTYDADLSGQVFVFTGFRDEVLAAWIGNAGGRVTGGISQEGDDAAGGGPGRQANRQGEEGFGVRDCDQE